MIYFKCLSGGCGKKMTYLTDNRGCNLCGAPCEIVDEPGIPTHNSANLVSTSRCFVDKGTSMEEDKDKDKCDDLTESMSKLALPETSKTEELIPPITDNEENTSEDPSQGWNIIPVKKLPVSRDRLQQEVQEAQESDRLVQAPDSRFVLSSKGTQRDIDLYSNPFASLRWDFGKVSQTNQSQSEATNSLPVNCIDKVQKSASKAPSGTDKSVVPSRHNLERDHQASPISTKGSSKGAVKHTEEKENSACCDTATAKASDSSSVEQLNSDPIALTTSPVTRDTPAESTVSYVIIPEPTTLDKDDDTTIEVPRKQATGPTSTTTPTEGQDPVYKVATQEDIDKLFERCKKKDKKRARKARRQAAAASAEESPKQPVAKKSRAKQPVAVLEKPEPIVIPSSTTSGADGWNAVARKGRFTKETSVKGRKAVHATSYLARQAEEDEEDEFLGTAIQVRFRMNGAKHDARRVVPRYVID
ncbi:hypothetical protein PMZ80_009564 [Knufia obscura]|uniref:Uncharacterized protein n=1 Tax=Knufia obscura TaxID=1635080 RepID=A0ABR0RBK0_9EURO|nr:hypothetical protein PMZ80_009564 [Knufia obscura]